MSKGQFYHYFKTKDELAFEVLKRKSQELIKYAKSEVSKKNSFKEKLFEVFAYHLDDENQAYRACNKIVNSILHLLLNSTDRRIREFNDEIYHTIQSVIDEIFESEISKKNLPSSYKKYAKLVVVVADGMDMQSLSRSNYDIKSELTEYLNDIVQIFENAKDGK
jgi:AcrR family transcriptional regulator